MRILRLALDDGGHALRWEPVSMVPATLTVASTKISGRSPHPRSLACDR